MATNHTPVPWKAVSTLRFSNGSGIIYTSLQPANPDPETMRPLLMASGEYHVCRMSHTGSEISDALHKANAAFIALAVNSHADLVAALKACVHEMGQNHPGDNSYWKAVEDAEAALVNAGEPS